VGPAPAGVDAAYGDLLAYVHEAGFSDLARAAAREVRGLARPPALVVDLGCGGGTLAGELDLAGFRVVGCDLSPAMVRLARRRVPAGRFEVADALDFPLPRCRAVTAVGEVMNYAAAARALADLEALFTRVRQALEPGGFFLFDAATTAKQQGSRQAARSGPDWRVEAEVVVEGDRLVRSIEAWRRHGGREETASEVHRQRLLDPGWVVARLEAAGFTVETPGAYDDLMLQEGWDLFLARAG
jgi:SAM-dependent methyltransferase